MRRNDLVRSELVLRCCPQELQAGQQDFEAFPGRNQRRDVMMMERETRQREREGWEGENVCALWCFR